MAQLAADPMALDRATDQAWATDLRAADPMA